MDRGLLRPDMFCLGFGCVQLTMHREESEAVSMLERAFDLGITHFDVARAYGFGRAEGILGKFLRGRRNQITVATKLGLQPPAGIAGNARLINAAKRLLTPFPALLRLAKRSGSAMGKSGVFTPDAAIHSLDASLRALGTGYVDILLLHEARLSDAADQALIEALQQQVAKGKIRHLGIASDFWKLQQDSSLVPPAYDTVQFNDNAWQRNLPKLRNRDQRLLITHSVFEPAARLREAVKLHAGLTAETSRLIGADITQPEVIAALLLAHAMRSNAEGIVLFSSTEPRHLEANVRTVSAQPFHDAQLEQFVTFVDQVLGPPNISTTARVANEGAA